MALEEKRRLLKEALENQQKTNYFVLIIDIITCKVCDVDEEEEKRKKEE